MMSRVGMQAKVRKGALVAAMTAAFLGLTTVDPAAAIEREALKERVEERFDAEVLKMREGEHRGRPVWLVTMMRKGGNDNAAFKVDTIAVDPETGQPLHGVLLDSRGSESLPSARTGIMEKRPEVLRERPWR